MSDFANKSVSNRILLIASICAMLPAGIELLVRPSLPQTHPDPVFHSIPMALSTAICFILLSVMGILESREASRNSWIIFRISIISFVTVFCGLDLLNYFGAVGLDVEGLLLPTPDFLHSIPLDRMSPLTAALFVTAGTADLLLIIRAPSARDDGMLGHLSGLLACVTAFSGFTLLLGYLYGTPLLYSGGFIPVAATTAISFLFLGTGLLARLNPRDIPKRYFQGSSVHRKLSRAFVPLVFLAVLVQGVMCRFAPIVLDINDALLSAMLAGAVAILAIIVTSKTVSLVGDAIVKAEEALRAGEERKRLLAAVLEQSSQPFCVGHADGSLGIVNRAFCRLTGYDEDELRSSDRINDLTPPEYREREQKALDELLRTGASVRYEKEYIRKDGKRIPVELLVSLMPDEQGQIRRYCVFVTDLTERKRYESALYRAGQEWERTFNAFSDLIMVLDKQNKIIRANLSMAESFGLNVDDIIGKSCFDLVHKDDKPPVFCPNVKLLAEGGEHSAEVFEPCLGGTYEIRVSPLKDEQEQIVGSVHIVRDISARKRMEDALKQSESTLGGVLRSAPVGIGLIINRTFKWTNEHMSHMTGYSQEELLGNSTRMLYESEEEFQRVGLAAKSRRIGITDKFSIETKLLRKDGSVIDIILNLSALDPANPAAGTVFSVLDVTERNRTARELSESERRYRAVFDNVSIGINMVDRERKLSHTNPAFLNLLGYTADELRQFSPPDITHPDDREITGKYMEGILNGNLDSFRLEKRYIRKDGSIIWGDLSVSCIQGPEGTPIAAVGVIADITERKRMEFALKESEESLRHIIDSSPIGIRIVRDGNYVYVNPSFARMFGFDSTDDIIGSALETLYEDDSKEFVRKKGIDDVFSGQKVSQYEAVGITRDGKSIDVIASATRINYFGQKASLGFIVDVTESKKLKSQLIHAQKMEAIGTLAGGIAHDFNNIIFAISGYTELALEELPEDSHIRSDLNRVLNAAKRAGDMVKQILTFSRQAQPERKPLDVAPIVKEGLKFLRGSIPTTIEISHRIEPSLDRIFGDPTQIYQVLINFCTNAAYAMRGTKGVLRVELCSVELDQHFASHHPPLLPGKHIKLSVGDTGHGIPPEHMDRIFEPYFTTKNVGEGTGLGLAVVHGIVKSHGGIITVYSELDRGSTFNIFLPVVQEDVGREESDIHNILPTGTERILIVDDEAPIVEMVQKMLESLGFKVEGATNPAEALELFRSDPGRFDIVITDFAMPKITGTELAQELNAVRSDIPIILCTGFSQMLSDEEAAGFGIRSVIMKPVLKKDIVGLVRRILDQRI